MVSKVMGLDQVIDSIVSRLGDLEMAFLIDDYAEGKDTGIIDLVLVGDIDEYHLNDLSRKTERYIKRKIRSLVVTRDEFNELVPKLEGRPRVLILGSQKELGVDQILVRNLVQEPGSREKLMGTAFSLRLLGALILFVLVFSAAEITYTDKTTKTLVLIIAGGILFQAFNVIDFYFQSQVLSRFTSQAQIFTLWIGSGARLLLIAMKASLIWFAAVTVLENASLAIFLFLMYRNMNLYLSEWRFDKNLSIKLLRDAWPLMLAGAAVMVYMRIDQVMIKEMLDTEAVGNYAAAVRFSEIWYFIPVALCNSLFPAIMSAKRRSKEEYHDRLQKLYDLMVWLAVAIALPTTFLADWMVFILLGTQYRLTAGVLKIHVWAGVFVFFGIASSKWSLTENLQRYSFYRTLSGAIANILLNMALIPTFGINGAAWATLISQFMVVYLTMVFMRQARDNLRLATRSFNPVSAYARIFHAWCKPKNPGRYSV
jgi:O-antigen/teichoic acid export membrane protein